MTPCIPPDRMAAIAASVAAPAIVHDREQPAPVVALPTSAALETLRRMRTTAVDDAHQAIDVNRLLAAARAASQEDGGISYPAYSASLGILLIDLAMELNRLRGHGAKPQAGCQFLRTPLGDSEALIEYSADDEGDLCVERALINGRWVATHLFDPDVRDRLDQAARADIEQQRRDDAETHAVRRYEALGGL